MKKPLLAQLLLPWLLLVLGACTAIEDSKKLGVSGIVVMKPNIVESYIQTRIDSSYGLKPVEGAKILLAFDEKGKDPIEGCQTESDAEGLYKIDTSTIPAPKDQYGYYYLLVEKPGYQRLVRPITIGPMSSYQKNTVILKPLDENEKE